MSMDIGQSILLTNRFTEKRWKVMQWGFYAVSLCFLLYIAWLWFSGGLNIFSFLSMGYCAAASATVGFVTWYVRWYWSDNFVMRTARRAVKINDPEFTDRVIEIHPRRADIRREMERLARN